MTEAGTTGVQQLAPEEARKVIDGDCLLQRLVGLHRYASLLQALLSLDNRASLGKAPLSVVASR